MEYFSNKKFGNVANKFRNFKRTPNVWFGEICWVLLLEPIKLYYTGL